MKKNFFFSLFPLLLINFCATAQTSIDEDDGTTRTDNYVFIRPVQVTESDVNGITGNPPYGSKIVLNRGTKFKYAGKTASNDIIIELWEYTDTNSNIEKQLQVKYNYFVKETDSSEPDKSKARFYVVSLNDFNEKAVKRYSTKLISFKKGTGWFEGTTITGGVLLLPYKIRPGLKDGQTGKRDGFDFSKDISLGISGGFKHRIAHYSPHYLNLLFNFGLSNVTLNEENTKQSVTESREVPAFTFATGLVFEFKKIQFGAFLGWDKIADRQKSDWIYQGRPWFSIGFGYSIFSVSSESGTGTAGKNSL